MGYKSQDMNGSGGASALSVVPAAKDDDMARALVRRHFLSQSERPNELRDVALTELDPELRTLLFTDGTVTRALEARALSCFSVKVIAERESPVPAALRRHMDLRAGASASLRRVQLHTVDAVAPLVYAESLIVPSRLPQAFLSRLASSRQGIGEALSAGRLESRRELLWFGLGTIPSWAERDLGEAKLALVRCYRVLVADLTAILISERFVVRRNSRDRGLCSSAWG